MIKTYEAHKVVKAIDTPSLRNSREYKTAQSLIIDETMSCDRDEAINWMKFYMKDALRQGNGTKNEELRAEFLAAYDLYKSLSGKIYLKIVISI